LHNIDATVKFAAYPEDSTNLEELVKMVK